MDFGECVYCGEQRELTRDHVPPRCLFSKPRPSNLVTVPCCQACNSEFQKYDEYFRLAITTGIDAANFPKELSDSVRAINNLSRPASHGLARFMLKDYERNPARLTIDAARIEVVLYRITRGLFYHHRNVRVPRNIAFAFRMVDENLKTNAQGQDRINRLAEDLTTIGLGTFRYAFEPFEPPDPFSTAWLMRFYDHKTFFCITASD
jgi:hypothetical protein